MSSKTVGDMGFWEQKTVKTWTKTCLLFCSILLFQCTGSTAESEKLPFYNTPDFTPIFIENPISADSLIRHKISNFAFLDQDSVVFSSEMMKNKIHVTNFIFTSCGSICPTMTKNFKLVGDTFPNDSDFEMLSFSVTPWIDTPAKLKAYKTQNQITQKNWHFLTGNKADIYALARTSYFAEEDLGFTKDSTEFLHTEHVLLVDKNQHIRGIYNGTLQLEMEQLIKDISSLKKEN
jgi:protein SCO1